MAYDTILYEVRERICTITLNRPEHMNSYNSQMCQKSTSPWMPPTVMTTCAW